MAFQGAAGPVPAVCENTVFGGCVKSNENVHLRRVRLNASHPLRIVLWNYFPYLGGYLSCNSAAKHLPSSRWEEKFVTSLVAKDLYNKSCVRITHSAMLKPHCVYCKVNKC
ncbi:hypothetical protein J6590_054275 [Homalodisca vitripennis]|nr:hypothetical protein J6590_054275 [Homalodisca vitripennis]